MTADRAELLIIDATSMQEMARLHLPQHAPFDAHTCWLNQEKLARLAGLPDAV
jgi:carotenoid cleavage dioxygenase-like enzyme